MAWFRDAPVCQRQLGILVYTSRCKKATPTYTVVQTAVAAADRPIDMSLQIIPQRDISVLNSACYGGGIFQRLVEITYVVVFTGVKRYPLQLPVTEHRTFHGR